MKLSTIRNIKHKDYKVAYPMSNYFIGVYADYSQYEERVILDIPFCENNNKPKQALKDFLETIKSAPDNTIVQIWDSDDYRYWDIDVTIDSINKLILFKEI